METKHHSTDRWLGWLDELAIKDYVVIDNFLSQDLYQTIRTDFLNRLKDFTKAGIGTAAETKIRHDIRGDYTYWLNQEKDEELKEFWSLIEETVYILKRYCFLSLSGFEFHYANYPPGASYERHIDQFDNRGNRLITMVIYLNEGWTEDDGGELEIFQKDDSSIIIQPLYARCVIFKSAVVPHRVLNSKKNRYSLSGWLLHQPVGLGQLFG